MRFSHRPLHCAIHGSLLFTLTMTCAQAQTLGGAWDPLWGAGGYMPDMNFGYSVVGVPDIDGDLVPDIVVAAPWGDSMSLIDNGEILAYSGATGTYLWSHYGRQSFELRGFAMAAAGDWNGDGVEDIAVGSPYYDPSPLVDAGLIKILDGATGVDIHTIPGAAPGEHLGAAIAGNFDVDLDGVPDLLVGAPGSDVGGFDAGRVYLFPGAGGPGWHVDGAAADELFGFSVAALSDLDGDAVVDLGVGAPGAAPGLLPDAGRFTLLSGASGSTIRTHDGVAAGERMGHRVAGGLDLDGDAVGDYLYTGPGASSTAGRVRVCSGAAGTLIYEYFGAGTSDRLGFRAAFLDDVNQDGVPDFALVGLGPSQAGFLRLHDGATGALAHRYDGGGPGDRFASAIASVGDLDGDGVPELAVGTSHFDGGGLVDSGIVGILRRMPCLSASVSTLSASAGGSASLTMDFPDSEGGMDYTLLGSRTGTGPIYASGVAIPLTPDPLFWDLVGGTAPAPIVGAFGTLNAVGDGAIVINLPAGAPAGLVGATFWFAAASYVPPSGLRICSIAVPIEIVP